MSDGAPSYRDRVSAELSKTLRLFVETISGPRLQLWLLAVAAPIFTFTLWGLIGDVKSKSWPVEERHFQLETLANIAYWMCVLLLVLIIAFAAQLIAGIKLKGPAGMELDINTRGAEDDPPPPPVVRTVTTTDVEVLPGGHDGQSAEEGAGVPRG